MRPSISKKEGSSVLWSRGCFFVRDGFVNSFADYNSIRVGKWCLSPSEVSLAHAMVIFLQKASQLPKLSLSFLSLLTDTKIVWTVSKNFSDSVPCTFIWSIVAFLTPNGTDWLVTVNVAQWSLELTEQGWKIINQYVSVALPETTRGGFSRWVLIFKSLMNARGEDHTRRPCVYLVDWLCPSSECNSFDVAETFTGLLKLEDVHFLAVLWWKNHHFTTLVPNLSSISRLVNRNFWNYQNYSPKKYSYKFSSLYYIWCKM